MTHNLNRPNSGISTDTKNTGSTGTETQSGRGEIGTTTAKLMDRTENDGVLDVSQDSSTAVGGNEEGSIRQDQTGYAGS
jgi:hypothetical protein